MAVIDDVVDRSYIKIETMSVVVVGLGIIDRAFCCVVKLYTRSSIIVRLHIVYDIMVSGSVYR